MGWATLLLKIWLPPFCAFEALHFPSTFAEDSSRSWSRGRAPPPPCAAGSGPGRSGQTKHPDQGMFDAMMQYGEDCTLEIPGWRWVQVVCLAFAGWGLANLVDKRGFTLTFTLAHSLSYKLILLHTSSFAFIHYKLMSITQCSIVHVSYKLILIHKSPFAFMRVYSLSLKLGHYHFKVWSLCWDGQNADSFCFKDDKTYSNYSIPLSISSL